LNSFKNRIPSNPEIASIFGTVVFLVHTWAVRGFLYKLPSFLYYFSLGDVLSVLAYMMAFALLESIVTTIGLVILSLILPVKWFRQGFVYKCFALLVLGGAASIWLQLFLKDSLADANYGIIFMGGRITALAGIGLLFLFHNVKPLQKLAESIVDRLSVFSYIYVPVGALSLLVVIIRNLF
jgi:hypothetical protein